MKTILIVDDEPKILAVLKEGLERRRYRVVTALDGEAGWQQSLTVRPDLILLDVMMPKLDGFELLRRLKREDITRRIPVIMLTARGESHAIFRSQELGATDHINKPFEFDTLLNIVQRALHSLES